MALHTKRHLKIKALLCAVYYIINTILHNTQCNVV